MDKDTYIVAFLLAGVVAAFGTPLVRRLARRLGAEDDPAGQARKVHDRPIPRLGGLAIAAGFLAPIGGLALVDALGYFGNRISALFLANESRVIGLALGIMAILALGVYDDLKGANAIKKFLVQGSVAVGLFACGFRFEVLSNPFGEPFDLGLLALPFTVLWLVGIMNAVNLIDGLDGLAGGLMLISVSTLFLVSFANEKVLICLFAAALGGALLGFLRHNFHPATIFMGDTGSLFIGLVIGAISIDSSKTTATAALAIPVLALGLPIFDTLLAMSRRLLRGRNPFRADRGHVHHRLLALGLSHRQAVMVMYGIGLVFALLAIAMEAQTRLLSGIVLALAGGFAVLVLRGLGYDRLVMERLGLGRFLPRRRPSAGTARGKAEAPVGPDRSGQPGQLGEGLRPGTRAN